VHLFPIFRGHYLFIPGFLGLGFFGLAAAFHAFSDLILLHVLVHHFHGFLHAVGEFFLHCGFDVFAEEFGQVFRFL
jgi:hypothetical protein